MKKLLHIKQWLMMVVAMTMMGGIVHAQSVNEWEWLKIDKLIEKGTMDVAFDQTNVLLNRAITAKQYKEILVGVMMKAKISASYQEHCEDSVGVWLQGVKPYLDDRHVAIWHMMCAYYYRWYGERVCEGVAKDKSELFYNWSKELRYQEMMAHIDSALLSADLLQGVSSKDYKRILSHNDKSAMKGLQLTPMLLDVALLDAFETSKGGVEKVDLSMMDFVSKLVMPISEFSQVNVSNRFAEIKPLVYIQQLEKNHKSDVINMQIRLYVERLKYLSTLGLEDSVLVKGVNKGIEQYENFEHNEDITMLYYILANSYAKKLDYVKAVMLCDKALEKSRRNEGAVQCRQLKEWIEKKNVELTTQREGLTNRAHFVSMKSVNVKTAYFRLYDVSMIDVTVRDEYEALKKSEAKKVGEWQMEVNDKGDYREVLTAVVVPAMPRGEYILYVSSNARFDAKEVAKVHIINTDIAVEQRVDDGVSGIIRSRLDGSPLGGYKMALRYNGTICATAMSDSNGYYKFEPLAKSFNIRNWNSWLDVYDSNLVWKSKLNYDVYHRPYVERKELQIFVDKPVYKMGETIDWAFVLNDFDGKNERQVMQGMKVDMLLMDCNRKIVDSMRVVTDEYGRGYGAFGLQKEGLNGEYMLEAKLVDSMFVRYKSITTIAYKQPKFMVSLVDENKTYPLNEKSLIEGMAVAYSGASMSGSVVKYTIERSRPYMWRRYEEERDIVATGQTVCDKEGRFEIEFVPTMDKKRNKVYSFLVTVSVTDVNGESQSQSRVITSSENPRQLMIVTDENQWDWKDLRFSYLNLDQEALKGNIGIRIDKLQQTDTARLVLWGWSDKMQRSISEDVFKKDFPCYAYDSAALNAMNWSVEKQVLDTLYKTECEMVNVMELPRLETGVYRVTMNDSYGTKAVKVIRVTHEDALKCLYDNLLWSDVEKTSCEEDSIAKVRIGSRYHGVNVLYNIVHDGRVIEKGMFELNDEIKFLMIPVTKIHVGGFTVNFSAVYQNMGQQIHHFIEVPYTDKENDIELVTFRDKIKPGAKETWTFKTSKPNAAMLLTMYDEALTTYRLMSWNMKYWKQHYKDLRLGMVSELSRDDGWNCDGRWYDGYGVFRTFNFEKYSFDVVRFNDALNGRLMYGATGSSRPMLKSANGDMVNDAVEEEVMVDRNFAVETESVSADEGYEVDVRTDLNPRVFFLNDLVTDSKGLVSVSFEAPELLTRWNVQGFSWTKDMAVGDFMKQVVTQKDLMVVPNVPRFMRQGDKMSFNSKVSNMSGRDEHVVVEFWLTNAQDESVVVREKKSVSIASGESKSVVFEIEVPDNMFVANYKIVAKGRRCSDGEQGQIPVLSNRQMVTESMAMYINGNEEKTYSFDRLKENNSESLQHYGITLEFTSNPMWYALQALPHMEEHKSPSMIYLMNQLYVNLLGDYIVCQNPIVEETFKSWSKGDVESSLVRNEAIKQTLLTETPWLNQAQSEMEQYQQVAQYFDTVLLKQSIMDVQQKLFEGQRTDGGWSWIAGDRESSKYVTEYILMEMGALMGRGVAVDTLWNERIQKALNYCDKEEYENYERVVKDNKKAEISNLYYLYMRSFYPDYEFEKVQKRGYEYFYKNALKNYKEYKDLYTQAQLSLIFYRNGDKREAFEIANGLKSRALYSDEMGMYWRDNVGGYCWYKRPIETQTMLIKMFDEVLNDKVSVGKMQQWLLKQKQTTNWGNDVATANAIDALLCGEGAKLLNVSEPVEIKVGGKKIDVKSQRGTGYLTKMWDSGEMDVKLAEVSLKKVTNGCAWGAMYWQYFEDLDKIEYSEMGIKMDKRYYRVELSGDLTEIKDHERLEVGDKVRVRIMIDCDRNLEYLQLKDQRASAFEPTNSESGWRWDWKEGMSYYMDVQDACVNFYINRLNKGKYVLEYDMWVTNSGDFSCGIASMQCMYAPEFRCNTGGIRMKIE